MTSLWSEKLNKLFHIDPRLDNDWMRDSIIASSFQMDASDVRVLLEDHPPLESKRTRCAACTVTQTNAHARTDALTRDCRDAHPFSPLLAKPAALPHSVYSGSMATACYGLIQNFALQYTALYCMLIFKLIAFSPATWPQIWGHVFSLLDFAYRLSSNRALSFKWIARSVVCHVANSTRSALPLWVVSICPHRSLTWLPPSVHLGHLHSSFLTFYIVLSTHVK